MRLLFAFVFLAFIASCSDSSTDAGSPQPGVINVSTVTTGPEPDPDGYSVGLDGVDQGAIGLNATIRIENVDPGDHAVQLNGVSSNCTLTGENPRSVKLTSGGVVPVSFQVNCLGTLGGIHVTTTTTGSSTDPDGYIVSLDNKDRLRIGVNDETTFTGLPAGSHEVGLEDVSAGCQVAGDNPRPVAVTGSTTREATFRINCP
jgi:hypothetical protein